MAKEKGIPLESLGIEVPYSMKAEQAVLGAALTDPEQLPLLSQKLKPEYFYSEKNRAVYEQIQLLAMDGVGIDTVTLVDALADSKEFDSMDEAFRYVKELIETVPSVSNANAYADIVADRARKREVIHAAQKTLEESGNADSQQLLELAEQSLYAIRNDGGSTDIYALKDAMQETMSDLQHLAADREGRYKGIPTGFSYLDNVLAGGLGRSDLIIVAARPGMGKSSFALNIATSVAKNRNVPTVVFSLEMSRSQLTGRILSSEAMVDSHAFRTGNLDQSGWDDLAFVAERLATTPLFLDDTPGLTVSDMKAKIRLLNQRLNPEKIGLVVVDYLQLMTAGRRIDNRVQEISEITRNLKIIAKEFNVPVIALSQLSRAVEKNSASNKRPQLSDLRDSGSIEQDADIVLFLYRDSYYASIGGSTEGEVDQDKAECIVAKNRHGEVSTINIGWDGAHTRFYNLDYTHGG